MGAVSTATSAATIDVSGAATGANTHRRRCCAQQTHGGAVSRSQSGYGYRAHIASTTCIASFAEACSATEDVAANTRLINLCAFRRPANNGQIENSKQDRETPDREP